MSSPASRQGRLADALTVLAPPQVTRDYRPEDQAADEVRKIVRELEAALQEAEHKLGEAHEVIEDLRRHGCDWVVELFTVRLQEAERALREIANFERHGFDGCKPTRWDLADIARAALAAAAAPSGPGLEAQLAQVERAWSRDRESLEAALYRLPEAAPSGPNETGHVCSYCGRARVSMDQILCTGCESSDAWVAAPSGEPPSAWSHLSRAELEEILDRCAADTTAVELAQEVEFLKAELARAGRSE